MRVSMVLWFQEAEQNLWIIDLCEIIIPGKGSESIYQAIHLWFCNLCHENHDSRYEQPSPRAKLDFQQGMAGDSAHIYTEVSNWIEYLPSWVLLLILDLISEINGDECVLIIRVGWQARFKWALQMLSSWMRKMCWIEPQGQLTILLCLLPISIRHGRSDVFFGR